VTPSCPDRGRLERFLADDLDGAEEAALSGHVEGCAGCQQALEELLSASGGAAARLGQALSPPESDPSSDSLLLRLRKFSSSWRPDGWPSLPAVGSNRDFRPEVPGYEVLGELGRGGMGVVYKARDLQLNRVVALKMILAGRHADTVDHDRFRREATAVARLQHPNIVQLFEFGEANGLPFFALEFVEGGTLAARLAKQLPSATEAARLLATLAEAVHAAHSRNVIHRDLKPANVLLTADGVPKIADFGLARLDSGGRTRQGEVLGTPGYMAPEQASGPTQEVGPAADVYALGAILYAALTGRAPFADGPPLALLLQVAHREPTRTSRLRPGVPRDLETICLKCLRKEPERRYASARELADDLHHFERGKPVLARPVGAGERLVLWARRHPTTTFLLALVLLLLVIGTVVSTFFALRAERNARTADENRLRAEEQERQAKINEQRARESERQVREAAVKLQRSLAHGLGRPLAFQEGPLQPAEKLVLRELSRTDNEEVRYLLFAEALGETETAVWLGRRADVVVQAAVGLAPQRRQRVRELLLARLRDRDAELALRESCLPLGAALDVRDAEFARAAAGTILERMEQTSDPASLHGLAQALAVQAGRLPSAEGATVSGRGMQLVLNRLTATPPAARGNLAAAVGTLAGRAEAATEAILGRLAGANEPLADLCAAVVALAPRLDIEAARTAARRVLALTDRPDSVTALARAASALAARLPAKEAIGLCTPIVGRILQRLEQATSAVVPADLAEAVAVLAERLEAPQAAARCDEAAQLLLESAAPSAPALALLAERIGTRQAVDLLKQPWCVGPLRQAVLQGQSRRTGRPFADVWEFVNWAVQDDPTVDLTAPPSGLPHAHG
jgi:hypothetical protein